MQIRIKNELNLMNGFRRAKVTWKPFKSDFVRPILKNKEKRRFLLKI